MNIIIIVTNNNYCKKIKKNAQYLKSLEKRIKSQNKSMISILILKKNTSYRNTLLFSKSLSNEMDINKIIDKKKKN